MINKRVLVTGGTGSIGSQLVRGFASQYSEVVFQFGSAHATATSLAKATGAHGVHLDLADSFVLTDTSFDIVINSAAVLLTKTPVHEIPDEELHRTLAVNLVAPFTITRACLPHMLSKRWGRVINLGSIYSLRGAANNASYNMAKHGLTGLTKSLALDYASFGVTANDICPSAVDSNIMRGIAADIERKGDQTGDEFLDGVRASNPTHRMAQPADVVSAALFLASDGASFINGTAIVVDGGQIA